MQRINDTELGKPNGIEKRAEGRAEGTHSLSSGYASTRIRLPANPTTTNSSSTTMIDQQGGKKVGFKLLSDEEKKSEDLDDIGVPSPHTNKDEAEISPSNSSSHRSKQLHRTKGPPPSILLNASSSSSTQAVSSPASSSVPATPSNPQQQQPKHGSIKLLTRKFRISGLFRNRRRGDNQGGDSEEEEPVKGGAETTTDNDPVMDVFQKRYKNRVRWSLDEQPIAADYAPPSAKQRQQPQQPAEEGSRSADDSSRDNPLGLDGNHDSEDAGGVLGGSSSTNTGNSLNIKKFVKGALFGVVAGSNKAASDKEFQSEVAKEVEAAKDLVWESNIDTALGGEVIFTTNTNTIPEGLSSSSDLRDQQLTLSFTEDPKTRASVSKLIRKGRRAQHHYYRYEYAVKYFVRALDMLTNAKYPDQHPLVQKTLQYLNNAHHALSSFNNSANIVKIGIKYEDSGELIRALKMYSIAYRIRRDNLSRTHPSLVVLLNMLGSIQTKRGELEEAMQIYELALKDAPAQDGKENSKVSSPAEDDARGESEAASGAAPIETANSEDSKDNAERQKEHQTQQPLRGNLLAKSVTYREMGTINEKWGNLEEALKMYHLSLDCVAEWKATVGAGDAMEKGMSIALASPTTPMGELDDAVMEHVQVKKSLASGDGSDQEGEEKGEMETFMDRSSSSDKGGKGKNKARNVSLFASSISYYDSFFPPHLEEVNAQKGRATSREALAAAKDQIGDDEELEIPRDDYADIDVALTIHQIAQLFRRQGQFSQSLEAYTVALRGMKYSLGNNHPNVAAILGNFGNLQKEMGDLDAAYATYQEVLGIESYRLGLSHPDVAITLHNIATIDAARGNHERALTLYKQVMCLQEKLFGREHVSVAVTAACMGDVYEQLGQLKDAFESYEESLRIKSAFQGAHSLDTARILHKLAKVALDRGDHRLANTYISRTIFVYRINKIPDDHEWVIDAHRDSADIDASIALTKRMTFEC